MTEKHMPSQYTYDDIANWIHPDFFYSTTDKWWRMGMLGVFGDFVLNSTHGDIIEIGVGESSIYLSALARKYNRHMYYCDIEWGKIENPLTIPGYLAPERGTFFKCSSDQMFEQGGITPIALGFIDGWHSYEQAKKDFYNIKKYLVKDGYILLHDTYPPDESFLDVNRCGDVYKFRLELESDGGFDCLTLPNGAAMNVGLTIVRPR